MKRSTFDWLVLLLWSVLPFIMVWNRKLMSVVLIFLSATLIVKAFRDRPSVLLFRKPTWIELTMLLLFVTYLIQYIRFLDHPKALFELVQKLPLLVLPLIWRLSKTVSREIPAFLKLGLTLGVLSGGIFLVIRAVFNYYYTQGSIDVFSYSDFTSPLKISPIYLAYFFSIAILFPNNESCSFPVINNWNKKLNTSSVQIFLFSCLLLCSSKLFTFLTFGMYAVAQVHTLESFKFKLKHALIATLFLFLLVPVGNRMLELANTETEIVLAEQYEHNTPFNGLTLRLVQLRFGIEIIKDEAAYLLGVGSVNSQQKLNDKYTEYNMYTGNPTLGDKGYFAYNFHNQWMETLVSAGIFGFLSLLSISILLIYSSIHFKAYSSLTLITICFFFTESVIERELGIVMFSIICLLINNLNLRFKKTDTIPA